MNDRDCSIDAAARATLVADCFRRHPHEACGLLLGTKSAGGVRVESVVPVPNAWPVVAERPTRYAIDPLTQAKAESAALTDGRDLVGFYHSHPAGPSVPSPFDLERAWPGYRYLIVDLADPSDARLTVWALDANGAFVEHGLFLTKDF